MSANCPKQCCFIKSIVLRAGAQYVSCSEVTAFTLKQFILNYSYIRNYVQERTEIEHCEFLCRYLSTSSWGKKYEGWTSGVVSPIACPAFSRRQRRKLASTAITKGSNDSSYRWGQGTYIFIIHCMYICYLRTCWATCCICMNTWIHSILEPPA